MYMSEVKKEPFQVQGIHRLGVLVDRERQAVVSDDPGGGFQIHLPQPLLLLPRIGDLPVCRQEFGEDVPCRPLCAPRQRTHLREQCMQISYYGTATRHSYLIGRTPHGAGAGAGWRGGWVDGYTCVRTCVKESAVEIKDHGGDLVRRGGHGTTLCG
jgi:hypothetical protein